MQTLSLTITLPDLIRFDDRDALEMQALFVQHLLDSGRLDVRDPRQRTALLEWYQKLAPHLPHSQDLQRRLGLPEHARQTADIVADLDAEMQRLEKVNNWTAATYEQWLTEHLRTTHGRP